jgi:hypothetical protein
MNHKEGNFKMNVYQQFMISNDCLRAVKKDQYQKAMAYSKVTLEAKSDLHWLLLFVKKKNTGLMKDIDDEKGKKGNDDNI